MICTSSCTLFPKENSVNKFSMNACNFSKKVFLKKLEVFSGQFSEIFYGSLFPGDHRATTFEYVTYFTLLLIMIIYKFWSVLWVVNMPKKKNPLCNFKITPSWNYNFSYNPESCWLWILNWILSFPISCRYVDVFLVFINIKFFEFILADIQGLRI